jgi:hypothetical protein
MMLEFEKNPLIPLFTYPILRCGQGIILRLISVLPTKFIQQFKAFRSLTQDIFSRAKLRCSTSLHQAKIVCSESAYMIGIRYAV